MTGDSAGLARFMATTGPTSLISRASLIFCWVFLAVGIRKIRFGWGRGSRSEADTSCSGEVLVGFHRPGLAGTLEGELSGSRGWRPLAANNSLGEPAGAVRIGSSAGQPFLTQASQLFCSFARFS